jgi:hypothetical protein
MGKSRKAPYFTDNGKGRKGRKRVANKTVRNAKDVGNNSSFKKQYESWDICDFSFHCPKDPKAYRK